MTSSPDGPRADAAAESTSPENRSPVATSTAQPALDAAAVRRGRWSAGLLLATGLLLAAATSALVIYASLDLQDQARSTPTELPGEVGIEQKLHAQVPLDIILRDEKGVEVRLGDLANGRPILLAPVYFECPMLCNMTRDGQARSMNEMSLNAGTDYLAITVSFDPRENYPQAAAAKRSALSRYGRQGGEQGWRFLTGEESQVRRLTDAVGFRYQYEPTTDQYAHAAGVIVLTPEGVVSRYLYGVAYDPRDLRLALVEASGGQVGTAVDQVLLLCYHYDPINGKYGLAIVNMLRLSGLATVLGMGAAIFAMIRRDRQRQSTPPSHV
ncbi:SCO family protein [Lignipirellula cremea]|uniref:SCO family protein n=1 Tax=Lignipirellula cremea TaxID=2528010 RepID=A0A518E1Y3_9BACT|nr:SCO family protein [Lignipirellula cremea]QDU98097.1 hypothetical protein Pla8534_59580 [Lignipirellula cremea]